MPKIILSVKLTRLHGTKCGDADALKVCVVSTTTHEYMGHQIRSQTMVVKPPPLTKPQAQQRSDAKDLRAVLWMVKATIIHLPKYLAGSVPHSCGSESNLPQSQKQVAQSNTAMTARMYEHKGM